MAEFSILHFAEPGGPLVPIGVLLFDTARDELLVQCRNDWDRFSEEDAGVLRPWTESLIQLGREFGAGALLNLLEESLSNSIRISDRRPIESTNLDATLETLYSTYVRCHA